MTEEKKSNTPLSKTQLKKEMHKLQHYAELLLTLSARDLETLPLTEALISGITEAQRIRSRKALRRHKQYLGKLIRNADHVTIIAGIERLSSSTTRSIPHRHTKIIKH